jgi:hypothetical protein
MMDISDDEFQNGIWGRCVCRAMDDETFTQCGGVDGSERKIQERAKKKKTTTTWCVLCVSLLVVGWNQCGMMDRHKINYILSVVNK